MRERLAHIVFRGPIRERTVEPFLRLLGRIKARSRVKGVLFDISSGGGEVVASKDLYLAVRRLNDRVPVIATIGGIGASGGYLAALGARRIYAYPESMVGSIGVIYPHIAARDLVRRLGVSVDLIHAGEHKDAFQGYRPLTEEERRKVQALALEDYERFVTTVAAARKRSLDEIRSIATGEFWSGSRAFDLGLVDALGDREEALFELSRLTGVPVEKTVRLAPPRPFLARLAGAGAFGFAGGLTEQLREIVDESLFELGPSLRR